MEALLLWCGRGGGDDGGGDGQIARGFGPPADRRCLADFGAG